MGRHGPTSGMKIMKKIERTNLQSSQKGVTMIETLIAGGILAIISLGMAGLILVSIAANNRNKIDSTQTMLAEAIVEHVNSTLIGTQQSVLTDCAGNSNTIDTLPGGASLNAAGDAINFSEDIAADPSKVNYHMDYHTNVPCTVSGTLQAIYDIRWSVQLVGAATGSPTNTYLVTVSSRLKNHGEGNRFFPSPVTLRVLSGN